MGYRALCEMQGLGRCARLLDPVQDGDAANARGPDHSGRVELDKFHIDQLGSGVVGERVAVALAPAVVGEAVRVEAEGPDVPDLRLVPADQAHEVDEHLGVAGRRVVECGEHVVDTRRGERGTGHQ